MTPTEVQRRVAREGFKNDPKYHTADDHIIVPDLLVYYERTRSWCVVSPENWGNEGDRQPFGRGFQGDYYVVPVTMSNAVRARSAQLYVEAPSGAPAKPSRR